MPTPRHGSSMIISLAQRASSTRVFPDASGAVAKRSMMRGSTTSRPRSPTIPKGMIRINKRIHAPFALPTNDKTNVTKNVIGIRAIAPRE